MRMHYFVVGTNNMNLASNFYDRLFEETNFKQTYATERMVYWQDSDLTSAFAVAEPFNEKTASNGNGTMVGFDAGTEDEVKRLYQLAIDLGGSCEGKPGQRGPMFSAYLRDLDNNKICFSALSID